MANTLGRTWAQATLPWSGDTQTWGKGLGAATDTLGVGLGESASLLIVLAKSDGLTLGFTEVTELYGLITSGDILGVSVQEGRLISVVLDAADILTFPLTDTYELLSTSWPKDLGISSSWEMGAKAAPGVWVEQAELLDNSFEKSEHMEGAGVWQKNAPSSGSGWNSG